MVISKLQPMKKLLLVASVLALLPITAFAQGPPWQPVGQDKVTTTRDVGIKTTPTEALDVNGNTRLRGELKVEEKVTISAMMSSDDACVNNKLGINTLTPTEALDVVGNAKVSGTLTADSMNISGTSSFNQIVTGTISSPDSILAIGGSTILLNQNTNTWTSNNNRYTFKGVNIPNVSSTSLRLQHWDQVAVPPFTYSGKLGEWELITRLGNSFDIKNGIDNEIVMTMRNTGFVGIGTTIPTERLQIGSGNILINGSNNFQLSGDEAILFLGDNNHSIKSIFGGGLRISTFQAQDAIAISQFSGNVGIGTTTPVAELDVNGHIVSRPKDPGCSSILVVNPTNTAVAIGNHSANHGLIRVFSNSGAETVFLSGNPESNMWINTTGNFGIGTATPSAPLEVIGTIRACEVVVESTPCDFVFDPDYQRPTPFEKEAWYKKFRHLMGVDSGDYIEEHGFDLGKNASGMVMNIEENALDIIEGYKINLRQDDELDRLTTENNELREANQKMKQKYEELEHRLTALEK